MKPLPDVRDYLSNGKPLRELFAVAVLRALTQSERHRVLRDVLNPSKGEGESNSVSVSSARGEDRGTGG